MTTRSAVRWSFFFLIAVAASPVSAFASTDEAALLAERDAAVEQVKRIVNQPVQALARPDGQRVGMFGPGWFHDGATRPDFLNVDVRQTQEFPYDRFEYVSSDISPGLMYRGHDLEFNANTKLFYTDRTVPKKRLTPEEMAEINRLYRIIGQREQDVSRGERKVVVSYAAAGIVLVALAIGLVRSRAHST